MAQHAKTRPKGTPYVKITETEQFFVDLSVSGYFDSLDVRGSFNVYSDETCQ